MAKLNAFCSSIHLTPSGNGLPSTSSQLGRLMREVATVSAVFAGPSMLASASTPERFTVPLFRALQTLVSFSMWQRYNSGKLRQRAEQFARTVPQDLHSDTHQQERGEL